MINIENFKKLADYLLSLPEDYCHFDMIFYYQVTNNEINNTFRPIEVPFEPGCGCVACALGHGPAVGIIPNEDISWEAYCDIYFTDEDAVWRWCFSGLWEIQDNTPQGAGKRILWMLEHGVPENFHQQMKALAPLCYL